MTELPPKLTQPPAFWFSLAMFPFAIAGLAVRAARLDDPSMLLWVAAIVGGTVIALVILYPVILRVSVRRVKNSLPSAITIPTTVLPAAAEASKRLVRAFDDPMLQLRPTTYAALAFDAQGMHVVRGANRIGRIPAERIRVDGFGRGILGTRAMTTIVLRIDIHGDEVEFPFVPIRAKGNAFRAYSREEYRDLLTNLGNVLRGIPVTPGLQF